MNLKLYAIMISMDWDMITSYAHDMNEVRSDIRPYLLGQIRDEIYMAINTQ